MRSLATGAAMFVVVLAALLAAVGQLGKIDGQTLVAVFVGAAVAAFVVVASDRRRGR